MTRWRALVPRRHPRIPIQPLLIRREEEHHPSIGQLGQESLRARRLHRRAPFASSRFFGRPVWRTVRNNSPPERVVVEPPIRRGRILIER